MAINTLPIIGIRRLRMGSDGTGIRTLIGLYGCPLRCRYCLNPQSWNGHLTPVKYTPGKLYDKVHIDNLYFQASGGGLTFGGGEPLLHMPAIAAFANLCPNSWNLWAETSLYVKRPIVEAASKVFQHFVVDIKTANDDIYRNYTGGDLKFALDNLLYLKSLIGPDRITVRIPLIPGLTDTQVQRASIEYISSLGFVGIDTFAYKTDI